MSFGVTSNDCDNFPFMRGIDLKENSMSIADAGDIETMNKLAQLDFMGLWKFIWATTGADLTVPELDKLMDQIGNMEFDSLQNIVASVLGRRTDPPPTAPVKKPLTICVKAEFYYEVPAEVLPPWAPDDCLEKMVEAAFDDVNGPLKLSHFGVNGVINLDPCEINIDSFRMD